MAQSSNRVVRLINLWGFSALVFALAFIAATWRLDRSPDIFTDEIIYTRLGIRVNGEGALVWDSGEPFLVHPPFYFLVEGAYLGLTADENIPLYAPGDIFASVYHVRQLNALLAGLTAVFFFLLGKRLRGPWLGLLIAFLFLLDPFGLRINRRAMLETLAAFLSLSGMFVFLSIGNPYTSKPAGITLPPAATAILAGLILGLSILTKELAFLAILGILFFGMRELLQVFRSPRRLSGHHLVSFVTVAVAALTYTLYPIWVLATGNWQPFAREKLLAIQRLFGLVQLTGWNRPGFSLVDFLSQRLVDYGSSYLLLCLGSLAAVWILLMDRQNRSGRLLSIWGLLLYPFFTFIALFGSGNDQFFYFLLIPAILLVGYALSIPPSRAFLPQQLHSVPDYWSYLSTGGALLLLLVILPFNLFRWWTAFGIGQDNSYAQFKNYIQENVPVTQPLNASGDPIKYHYFFPERMITAAASAQEARDIGVHYFALAPKDIWARYGRITPELADWIITNGVLLETFPGDSYGDIHLYRVEYEDPKSHSPPVKPVNGSRWRSFQPAKGGFIIGLALWLLIWGFFWSLPISVMVAFRVFRSAGASSKAHSMVDRSKGQVKLEIN